MTTSPYLVTDYEAFKAKFPNLEPRPEPDFSCTWSIESVDVIPEKNGLNNIIDKVYIFVTREGATESFKLPVNIGTENLNVDNFIQFNSLNQSQVIEFVKNVLTNLRQDFVWDCEWAAPAPAPAPTQRRTLPT